MNNLRYSARIRIVAFSLVAYYTMHSHSSGAELRRPSAMAWLGGEQLCVLNQTGGSLSLIDPRTNAVTELMIGSLANVSSSSKLTDMAVIDDSNVVVLDSTSNELLVVRIAEKKADVTGRVFAGHSPTDVIVDGHKAYVSCLWSRRWSVVSVEDLSTPRLVGTVDLPFSPRHQILVADGIVFVLDAFGGQWATIDVEERVVLRNGHFAGSHNFSGLTLDHLGENVLIPHVTLNAEKPTTKFNVHWGDIILNVIRKVGVRELLNDGEISDNLYYLGRPDIAAGDPTRISVTETNRHVVCFAGTSEVGISDVGANAFDRVKVGCRPVDIVLGPGNDVVYVANQLDDTVSVVQVNGPKLLRTIRLADSETALTPAQHGERLFFDSTLSSDGWFSCHSCHTDGHTNGGLADTFGDGSIGDAKRVPSLLGVRETAPWAWSGEVADLSDQVQKSVETTMRGAQLTDEQLRGLVAYVRSFSAPPSVLMARGETDTLRLTRGRQVFESAGCSECHISGSFTSNGSYHVGFQDQSGRDKFNPPSLRAVSHRWRLLHDNRASSVRDVVQKLRHQNNGDLTDEELEDMVYFVEGL